MSKHPRYALAKNYNRQRARMIRAYNDHGHGAKHTKELRALQDIGASLHVAETSAGVPRGSTRAELAEACPGMTGAFA